MVLHCTQVASGVHSYRQTLKFRCDEMKAELTWVVWAPLNPSSGSWMQASCSPSAQSHRFIQQDTDPDQTWRFRTWGITVSKHDLDASEHLTQAGRRWWNVLNQQDKSSEICAKRFISAVPVWMRKILERSWKSRFRHVDHLCSADLRASLHLLSWHQTWVSCVLCFLWHCWLIFMIWSFLLLLQLLLLRLWKDVKTHYSTSLEKVKHQNAKN